MSSSQRSWTPLLAGMLLLGVVINQIGIWMSQGILSAVGQAGISLAALGLVLVTTQGHLRLWGGLGMLGCLAGDLAPKLASSHPAQAMIVAFAIGQLLLVVAFWPHVEWGRSQTLGLGIALVAYALVFLTWLSTRSTNGAELFGPMVAYAVLLVLMGLTAASTRRGMLGGLLFVLSDSLLAARLLGAISSNLLNASMVMLTYAAALLLLALALGKLARRPLAGSRGAALAES